jgi:hypothetical protein
MKYNKVTLRLLKPVPVLGRGAVYDSIFAELSLTIRSSQNLRRRFDLRKTFADDSIFAEFSPSDDDAIFAKLWPTIRFSQTFPTIGRTILSPPIRHPSNFHRQFDLLQTFIADSTSFKLSSPIRPPSNFHRLGPPPNFHRGINPPQTFVADSTSANLSSPLQPRQTFIADSTAIKL